MRGGTELVDAVTCAEQEAEVCPALGQRRHDIVGDGRQLILLHRR
jgi:hypothetical protein